MSGKVAAGNPYTAQAAAEVLAAGGNAVDGAAAGALAAFVAEPLLASAGGAGLMTIALPDRGAVTVDFFSRVPGLGGEPPAELDFVGVEVDFGSATQVFHIGRGSATVPLALDGIAEAVRQFGTLPLPDVVAPAERMARQGVPLSPEGSEVFRLLWPIVARDVAASPVLAPEGKPMPPGASLRNVDMADTLAAFAAEGTMPEHMCRALLADFGPARGGLITQQDLDSRQVQIVEPFAVDVGGLRALTSPRVGGKLVALILEELTSQAPSNDEAAEAVRFARASQKAHLSRAALTTPGSTTHISAIDSSGGVAAVTLTNGEGCGHLVGNTGVQLNNFLGEEDLNPHGYHLHEPGASLPTMIAPTVGIEKGSPVLALGSGGANRIRSSVSQVLYQLSLGRELSEAVLAPRIHAETDEVWVERAGWIDADRVVSALEDVFARVYPFPERAFFFGGVHAVLRAADGELIALAIRDVAAPALELPSASAILAALMSYSAVFRCIAGCEGSFPLDEVIYECPKCGQLLEVSHDVEALRNRGSAAWMKLFDDRYMTTQWPYGSGVWGKKEWVAPGVRDEHVVSMAEGGTNLFWAERYGESLGVRDLWIKMCGNSHTGSFKDLGMTVLVSVVKQMIADGKAIAAIACASTGDTSAALAAYCAAAGIRAVVLLPKGKVTTAQLVQPLANGAHVCAIDTDFDGCMEIVRKLTKEPGVYLANSMNSLRLEGQKTVGIEMIQQLEWRVPDWIIIPGGNLGNVSALGAGLSMLLELGLIQKRPRICVAQAQKANPLYLAYKAGWDAFEPVTAGQTEASAIRIGNPVSIQRAIRTLAAFEGVVEQASEAELAEASAAADRTGTFTCPHTGVALAALEKLIARGEIEKDHRVVVISTASGLKFTDFKVRYHEGAIEGVQSKHPNRPVDLPNDFEAVKKAVLGSL